MSLVESVEKVLVSALAQQRSRGAPDSRVVTRDVILKICDRLEDDDIGFVDAAEWIRAQANNNEESET